MPILHNDVVDLTMQLCEIDSVSGNEGEIVNLVARGLEENGWHVYRQKVYDDGKGRDNLYATRQSTEEHVPRLVLNSHFDTVPPLIPLKRTDENLYGRGVNEAKGQMAALIVAANRMVEEEPELAKDVALLFVVGEEIDHAGMMASNDLPGFGPEYLIAGEPTEMKYASIQKGALKVKLSVVGKAGHSGYPHAGESAIHKLLEILHDITVYPWPKNELHGDTTFNIGTISGGQALNAWAARAEAGIFFRVTTSYDELKQLIVQVVNGRAELDWSLGGNDPVKLSLPPYEAKVGQACFNTDLPYFRGLDKLKGAYLYGAGTITKAFGSEEFVPIAELRECVSNHVKLMKTLLAEK